METEHFFICLFCWEEISMLLDLSVDEQNYIEDCEVCCRPLAIFYAATNGELSDFSVAAVE